MMKIFRFLGMVLMALFMCVNLTSCSEDDDDYPLNGGNGGAHHSYVTAPSLDRYLCTTDYLSFNLRVRFKNGGDAPENMSCIAHWTAYPKKPAKKPTREDMRHHEDMCIIDLNKYKTTFDLSHAGYDGGTYIYYYFECSNSGFTTNT